MRGGWKVALKNDITQTFSKKPLTKKQAMKQLYAIQMSEQQRKAGLKGGSLPLLALTHPDIAGGGIIDSVTSRLKAFGGVRLAYRPQDRAFINKYGDYVIKAMTIYRAPVQKFVKILVNIVSFGKFKELVDKHFDEVYHLFLQIDLEKANDKQSIIIEKNQTISIKKFSQSSIKDAQSFPLKSIPQGMTFRGFLKKAEQSTTPDLYFRYDSLTTNCQHFIMVLLKANDVLQMNPGAEKFIFQDLQKLRDGLPSLSKKIMKGLTDTAAVADVVLHGYGLDQLGVNKRQLF